MSMFDLTEKNTNDSNVKILSTHYSDSEQFDKLIKYISINKSLWDLVRYNTHVRYRLKSGEFRIGGFVIKNSMEVKKGNEPVKKFFKLQNNFNVRSAGYATWIVAHEDIETLYAKPDAIAMTVQQNTESALRSLNENIKKLVVFTKECSNRIKQLEHN